MKTLTRDSDTLVSLHPSNVFGMRRVWKSQGAAIGNLMQADSAVDRILQPQ